MDSRFLHLLESNIAPTPLEAVAIQAEVERLSSKTHPTQDDPELEAATLGQYRGILSPIRQIPSEIWGEIFYFATPAVVSEGDKDDLLDLCCVCSAWHEAALHAHALWANIKLAPLPEGKQYIYNNLVSWLARSGDLKKGLKYRSNSWWDHEHEEDEEEGFCPCHSGGSCMWIEDPVVARLLTEGPLLLHRVSFQNMYPRCVGNAMRSFQVAKSGSPSTQPWNQIQELELNMHTVSWQGGWDSSSELPFKLIPPSVTSLLICLPRYCKAFDDEMECRRAKIDIPPAILGQLTSLVLVCEWGPLHIATMLHHCRNLETLRLEFGYGFCKQELLHELDDSDPMIRRVQVEGGIQLPKLHTLQMYDGYENPILFLQWIKTPALRFLDLETTGSSGSICPNWIEALDDFVTRSGCARSIQYLRLASSLSTFRRECQRFFNGKTGPFLSSLSSLKHLTFTQLPIVPVLTDFQNIEDPSNYGWLPQLQSLQFLHCSTQYPFLNFDQLLIWLRKRGRQAPCWINVEEYVDDVELKEAEHHLRTISELLRVELVSKAFGSPQLRLVYLAEFESQRLSYPGSLSHWKKSGKFGFTSDNLCVEFSPVGATSDPYVYEKATLSLAPRPTYIIWVVKGGPTEPRCLRDSEEPHHKHPPKETQPRVEPKGTRGRDAVRCRPVRRGAERGADAADLEPEKLALLSGHARGVGRDEEGHGEDDKPVSTMTWSSRSVDEVATRQVWGMRSAFKLGA
ncbi:hypothetical protein DFP72DRAFT_1050927 [Ephemerocybe angulata]|uniref:F-box domain-containing protein n=1 Tax=Ephemerocybe angulata TaxID=980116 RepID=A0A8H6HGG5_9AGAR|nr:hypothetical protein DFP72DRAFT_1050927 [Tulosesus angulatus]